MKSNRRLFLQAAGLTTIGSLLPFTELLANRINKEGFVTNEEDQETYLIAGRQAPVTIIVDKKMKGINSISFCREDIIPNDRIPVHKHLNEVEIIYIQKGSGIFTLGSKEYNVKEGSAAFVPKRIWHGLKNTGDETIRMIFTYAPSGFEGYFREIGVLKGEQWKEKSAEEFAAIDKKYGIVYKP